MLRGHYKQSDYGKIILPFVVLRRLDCILEGTKEKVLKKAKSLPEGIDAKSRDNRLFEAAGKKIYVYNTSQFTFETLKGQEAKQIHQNLIDYISKFSPDVCNIFEKFRFIERLKELEDFGILWLVFDSFCKIDLHPDKVSNIEMGYLFEDLIRRFSEISNETAGEHFTPREVIRLIINLLIVNDKDALNKKSIIRWVYDPACGTGGMLALAEKAIKDMNPDVEVKLFGQELNPEAFSICKSDMLVTGHDPKQVAFGNTLTEDVHEGEKLHYMLSNPPYGVNWKKYESKIKEIARVKGADGPFGAGLPRVSDGQLLFLQHMISKMRDDELGSRIGIVMNGSPLFAGAAGSGESEIRRWMLEENDWVEAIIAMPTDIFYNTAIPTYVWLLNNRKPAERHRKVQLFDASSERFWRPMRKNLGSKRREIPEQAINEIVRIYADMLNGEGEKGWSDYSKIFTPDDFAYREIQVEQPLRLNFQVNKERLECLRLEKVIQKLKDTEQNNLIIALTEDMPSSLFMNRNDFELALNKVLKNMDFKVRAPVRKAILKSLSMRDPQADICVDSDGNLEPDVELSDKERVPFGEDWREYFEREVKPFVTDAWVDEDYCDERDGKVGRVGYEINFNQYFYKYVPVRSIKEINVELKALEIEITKLLKEVVA